VVVGLVLIGMRPSGRIFATVKLLWLRPRTLSHGSGAI
jgi:hypothetical protein